jgi:hypothetical protein
VRKYGRHKRSEIDEIPLLLSKRAKPDIQPAIAFLSTGVAVLIVEDWDKLKRLVGYLGSTKEDILTLEVGHTFDINWYVDAAFATYADFKSYTGAFMIFGKGCIQAISTK